MIRTIMAVLPSKLGKAVLPTLRVQQSQSLNFLKGARQFHNTPLLATAYRDLTQPWSETDTESLRTGFKTIKSYKDGRILASDFGSLYEVMRWDLSNSQLQDWIRTWEGLYGPFLGIDHLVVLLQVIHNPVLFFRAHSLYLDKNGDGFISASQVMLVLEKIINKIHPSSNRSYEELVREVSVNSKGELNANECEAWIQKRSS